MGLRDMDLSDMGLRDMGLNDIGFVVPLHKLFFLHEDRKLLMLQH